MSIDLASVAAVRFPRARARVFWSGSLLDNVNVETVEPSLFRQNHVHQINPATLLHIADGVTVAGDAWAILDGSVDLTHFSLAPGTPESAALHQVGWYGSVASDAVTGEFVIPQSLILRTPQRPISRIDIYGDNEYVEYPEEFQVKISGPEGLLRTLNETHFDRVGVHLEADNILDLDGDNIYSADHIELAISKWSAPGSACKIIEFSTISSELYDGDEIMNISVLEEMEIKDATLPTGNISSNEIEFALNNVDDKFFPNNPDAEYHRAIRPGRKIVLEMGFNYLGTDYYVPYGTYWSSDWKVSDAGTTASTTARDRMERLRNTQYNFPGIKFNETVGDLVESILEEAKTIQLDLEYIIDPVLKTNNYIIPVAFGNKGDSYFDILKRLAEASLARCFVDRNDVINFILPEIKTAIDYEITGDNYYNKTLQADTESIANIVQVTALQYIETGSASDELWKEKTFRSMTPGETHSYIIEFSKKPVEAATLNTVTTAEDKDAGFLSGFVGVFEDAEIYSWGAAVTVRCVVPGSFRLAAYGLHYEVSGKLIEEVRDESSIFEYNEHLFELKENALIQSERLARQVADNLIDSFADPDRNVDLDWRGNLNVGLDSVLRVPEYKVVKGDYVVYKNQTTFDGTLKMVSTMRKNKVATDIIQDGDGTGTVIQDTDGTDTIIQM